MFRILLFSTCIIAVSCSSPNHPGEKQEKLPDHYAQKQREKTHGKPASENIFPPLKLNNGQRWAANPETSEKVEDLDETLDVFLLKDDPALEEYHSLGEELMNDYNDIFVVTTMTGEAYEQLKIFLLPIADWIDVLKTGELDACRVAIDELHEHMHHYPVYFD